MKLTTHIISLSLLLLFTTLLNAQNRGERVETAKVAFLSERLQLAPQTAEKFWPIYHQYDEEIRMLLQEKRNKNDERSAEEILDQEQKALDIKRKYSALFLKVISDDQLGKLYQSEREFNRMLIHRMKKMQHRQMRQTQNERASDERMQIAPRPQQYMEKRNPERKPEQPMERRSQERKPEMVRPKTSNR
ncbi:MAG: hypothetical protein IPI46_06710 [Bacteroidetes bacterium]|nr:hypothetical protein [Bacteroidota bacterium]